MKTSKRRAWGIVIGLVLVTGTGIAGYQVSDPIGVSAAKDQAWGALGGLGHTTSSSDKFFIGCQTVGENGKAVVGSCTGQDSTGRSKTCTTDSAYNDSVRMISASTYLVLYDQNLNGRCDHMDADVQSYWNPKSPGAATASKVEVTISTNPDFVKGALGTVYSAANQSLGCSLKATATTELLTCTARSNNNPQKQFDCTSNDPSVIEAARGIKEDSYLEITRSGGTCTKLLVKNDSRYAPRH